MNASTKSEIRNSKPERNPMVENQRKPVRRSDAHRISEFGYLLAFGFRLSAFVSLLTLITSAAHATIPEPDNVIFGSVTIGTTPITADRADVVIEARRASGGPAIASYQMGSDPALGNFYSLNLKLESVAPIAEANSSQAGDDLFIVLRDGSGVVGQANYTVPERGHVQRIDFGAPLDDADGNGLPDLWELAYLDSAGNNPNAAAANGQTVMQNYVAGTDPGDPNDLFRVEIERNGSQRAVWFLARKAEGPGFNGLTRRYTLQKVSNPASGSWQNVAGATDVAANNQTVNHQPLGTESVMLYRAMVSLVAGGAVSNSLPDDWEIEMFGSAGQDPNIDHDNDGMTTGAEYEAGSHPNNANDVFRVSITQAGNLATVEFVAREAAGIGYEGLTRRFTVETKPHAGASSWTTIPGFSNIPGAGQTVTLQQPKTNAAALYRASAQLAP
jgi:hypothetical protein